MLAAWFSPKALSASSALPNLAQILESFLGVLCFIGAAVLQHQLAPSIGAVKYTCQKISFWLDAFLYLENLHGI